MRRLLSLLTALPLAAVLAVAGPATSATAACPEVGNVYYSFSNKSTSRILSNLRSEYLHGPGSINYTKNKTATTNASMTGTVSAEAGVVFAKASASLGVTVGKTWSKGDSWSYTMSVPRGKTARMVMWHESRRFTVTKKRIVGPCNLVTVYRTRVNAPRKASINVWRLQYK
jgi:hypothetical protein